MGGEGNSRDEGNDSDESPRGQVASDPMGDTQLGSEKGDDTIQNFGNREKAFLARLNLTDWITAIGTAVIALATIVNVVIVRHQLAEMHSGGIDTHNLAVATGELKDAAGRQADAMDKLRRAGEGQAAATDKLRAAADAQAKAMDRLRVAGEAQARASDSLATAGRSQAAATRNLADNSARQLNAIQASADAAKTQAIAVQEQAAASITASKATDRLALAGQAQAAAVVQSLDVARQANEISARANVAADRPWVSISMPVGDTEPIAGQEYKIDFNVLNVGRSPALDATTNVSFTIIKITDTFGSVLGPCPDCQKATIFPSGGSFQATTTGFHPTLSAETMTADEVKRIADKKDVILLRNRVDYLDTSNNPHMTSGCMFFIPKFGFTNCPVGSQAN